jgi:rhamnose transport system permease protein
MLRRHRREATIAVAILAMGAALRLLACVISRATSGDLFLANLPVLIAALGMTLIILTGEIDVSVGSVFAVCGVMAGTVAKWHVPMTLVMAASCVVGGLCGGLSGYLVGPFAFRPSLSRSR